MVSNARVNHSRNDRLIPDIDPRTFLTSGEPWKAAIFLVLTFGLGFALSGALSLMLAISLFLSLLVVGIPLLALTAIAWTYMAQIERARISLLTGIEITKPYRPMPESGFLTRVKTFATDPAVWKDLVYLLVLFPVGILQLFVVLFAVVTPLALISAPLGMVGGGTVMVQGVEITSLTGSIIAAFLGLILLPVAAYVVTICARGHALIARWMLGGRTPERTESDNESPQTQE
jgi:hypothetical protein